MGMVDTLLTKAQAKLHLAMDFAREKHKGQKDDTGKDYYDAHLFPVGLMALRISGDYDVACAAILHDTIEDTNTTYSELRDKFGIRVAELVNEVTHEGEADNYGFYFPRLETQWGIFIKLLDRASNIARMQNWDDKRKEHYLKKTKFWKDGADKK